MPNTPDMVSNPGLITTFQKQAINAAYCETKFDIYQAQTKNMKVSSFHPFFKNA